MSQYRLAQRVVAEVDEIALFTASRWGVDQSLRYVTALQRRFAWIAANPLLGHPRDDVRTGLRCFRQGSHLIFYLIEDPGVLIVGVPHASMDIGAYFEEPE